MSRIVEALRSLSWFHWQPGWDVPVAMATILYMIPSYYLITHSDGQVGNIQFLFTNLVVNVLFPAYYILKVRGETLEELGLTKQRWLPSLLISLVLALIFLPRMLMFLADIPEELRLSTIIFNGLILWEPFFVHSWLQIRFERAFGVLPGIILAGGCLGLYHIGTYPPQMVAMLMLFGIFYALVFRLTRNLLVLWPFTWAIVSTMGTVSGGFSFGWITVLIYSLILLVQGIGIWWLSRKR
jgi:hypothetical protein